MFLKEAVVDSHAPAPKLNGNDDGFGGFTFVPKKKINMNNDDDALIPKKPKKMNQI